MTDDKKTPFTLDELLAAEARGRQGPAASGAPETMSVLAPAPPVERLADEPAVDAISVDDILGVLANVRSASGVGDAPHPDWARALVIVVTVEDELKQGIVSDVERVRALADQGLGMLPAAHDTEPASVTALRLVFGALRGWGRGAFDGAIVGAVRNASVLLEGQATGDGSE